MGSLGWFLVPWLADLPWNEVRFSNGSPFSSPGGKFPNICPDSSSEEWVREQPGCHFQLEQHNEWRKRRWWPHVAPLCTVHTGSLCFSFQLKCCGLTNYTDFNNSYYVKQNNGNYPPLCCNSTTTPCTLSAAANSGINVRSTTVFWSTWKGHSDPTEI